LVAQFGGAPGAQGADFNGDGIVDMDDFAILRDYFGSGVASAPEGEFAAAVPEPGSVGALLLGSWLFVHSRRKKTTGR